MSHHGRERPVTMLYRFRWRILWAIGVFLPGIWALRLLVGSPPVVTPSAETTFLTGHTLPDGSLDFSAALWQSCNTPNADADNAAILLRELAEPQSMSVFLSRYAMEQVHDPDHAWEVYAALCQEQGMVFDTYGVRWEAQSVRQPWRREQFPAIATLLEEDTEYLDQWKAAISRPAISKPLGTTIDEVVTLVYQGAARCLAQAMMYAGEGEWSQAIENFRLIDRSAEHLCHLQCGWRLQRALMLRSDLTRALLVLIRNSSSIDERFGVYIRRRFDWPLPQLLSTAIDRAIRIQAQTNVRDTRDPRSGRLGNLLAAGLTTVDSARDIQLVQLRNSIDWGTVARIQNSAIDDCLQVLKDEGLMKSEERLSVLWRTQADADYRKQLIEIVRNITGEDITVLLGRSVAFEFVPYRIARLRNTAVQVSRIDRMAVFAMAIAEFKQQHGRWPSSVEDLPRRSDAVDPATNQPFPYSTDQYDRFPVLPSMGGWAIQLQL